MVNTPAALYKPAQPPTCYTVRPAVPWIQRVTRQPSWAHTMATCWQGLWAYRFYLIVFFLPIFLLPLPILVPTKVRTWDSGHGEAPREQGRDHLPRAGASLGPGKPTHPC